METNRIFKYIFAAVVIGLIGYAIIIFVSNRSIETTEVLDQTSTVNNIQTDLRFAIAGYDTINPLISNNRNVQEIAKIIYDPLVTLDEDYKLEYCLADSIEKQDSTHYLIKLKKGVLWNDNTELTAFDVKFTFDKILLGGFKNIYQSNLEYVTDLAIVDNGNNDSLVVTLSREVPFFEYYLTFPIMCEHYYEGEDFAASEKAPIGTGMYKIESIEATRIKLVKNPTYWNANKVPMASEIYVNLYGTIGEVYNAFKSGDIDIMMVGNSNIDQYIGTLGYNKIEFKSRDYDFLTLNCLDPNLQDPRMRRALSLILDKNALIAAALGGGYVSSNFPLDYGEWLYTRDLGVETNIDEAKRLITECGWQERNNGWIVHDGRNTVRLNFTITVNNDSEERVRVAENIKEQLENVGIDVDIRYLARDKYIDALQNKNYQIILTGVESSYTPNLATFFGSGNIANYENEEMLAIIGEATSGASDERLYEFYNRLYDIYLEEAPYIGLYRKTQSLISNQSLSGNLKPNAFNMYHNIELWYRQ